MRNERQTHRKTGSFIARDTDGNALEIAIWTSFTRRQALGGHMATTAGRPRLYTTDGRDVRQVREGQYEMIASCVLLTSNDPTAP